MRDSTGAVVPGAQVSLVLIDGRYLQTLKSDMRGEFVFSAVRAGSYRVAVSAAGFAPFMTEESAATARQVYSLPEISIAVAGASSSIVVRTTEVIAAEQIKAEEKQRLLGIFPNFDVCFIPDAAPLTSSQKLSLATHHAFDWFTLAAISASAGIQQATNGFRGYGRGSAGCVKRWVAQFVTETSTDLFTRYVFASLFHQDPRYPY